jgi:hypothetical protein
MHMARRVLCESFFEPRRSREHDINLEEVDSPGQLDGGPGMYFFTFLLNERVTSR